MKDFGRSRTRKKSKFIREEKEEVAWES